MDYYSLLPDKHRVEATNKNPNPEGILTAFGAYSTFEMNTFNTNYIFWLAKPNFC